METVKRTGLILAVLVLILTGCLPQTPASSGTVVWGSLWEPSALNPIVAPDVVTKWILENIFDGLVAVNDKMEIIPELAESWDVSPDGKMYTFRLRKRRASGTTARTSPPTTSSSPTTPSSIPSSPRPSPRATTRWWTGSRWWTPRRCGSS